MQSLQIMEGLIGTACALACLYYARRGSLALQPQISNGAAPSQAVPWHSALGEYARRNPFAAVFGALAFGFLASSWMMYASPRTIALPPRTVEKWHTVTRNVRTSDPAQLAKIAALQTTINADDATIASQKADIDRLKQLLGKPAVARNSTRHRNVSAAADLPAVAPTEATENTLPPAANNFNARPSPAGVTTGGNAGAALPAPSQPNPGSLTATGNATTTNPAAPASPNPTSPGATVPH